MDESVKRKFEQYQDKLGLTAQDLDQCITRAHKLVAEMDWKSPDWRINIFEKLLFDEDLSKAELMVTSYMTAQILTEFKVDSLIS